MDKKIVKIIGIVVGVFVIFIIFLLLLSSCSKKKLDYNKLQDNMVAAARSYYQSKPDDLPKEDGDSRNIQLKKLVSEGYMEDPSKTFKNNDLSCDGSVTVTNNYGNFLYSPSLTCGKEYKSQLLKDKVIDDSLVESGVGLYETKDQYIFRGEVNNNYVKFQNSAKLFRIIRINEDGTIRLIEESGMDSMAWDDRYNPLELTSTGVNDYIVNNINSRIKDEIKKYYNDSSVWPESIKAYIVTQDLCIGKRSKQDITKDGSTECAVKLANQQLGLLNVYEYLIASLDNNCNSTTAVSCSNYNWLATFKKRFWTVTGDVNDTAKVYRVSSSISSSMCSNSYYVNTVFNISDKVQYVAGEGTKENPYVFR